MSKRFKEPSLLLLAVIGCLLYFGVNLLSPYMEDAERMEEVTEGVPSVTKEQAAGAALGFAREHLGLTAAEPETIVIYQAVKERSGYLQKERLYDDYQKRFGEKLPLEFYEVEIGEPGTGLTHYIQVNYTNRRIIGWETGRSATARSEGVFSEPAPDAEAVIRKTMADQGYAPDTLALVSGGSDATGPNTLRIYRSKEDSIGSAPLELHVKETRGRITLFRPEFPVPDTFTAWKNAQDDTASLMTWISMGLSTVMTLTAFILVIRGRRDIRFGRGLILTLIFAGVYVLNNFNMLPAFRTEHGSGPSEPQAVFYLWFVNIFVLFMAVSTYLSLLAGRQLWLRRGLNPWPVWSDASFGDSVRTAMVRGYLFCLFVLGLQQVMFFAAAELFDVWAVSDPADSVYNMRVPGVFPLMAWAASISEEAVYRLLGIALVLAVTRSRFLAVLLPSIIWAMSHTQYPIYPVYTRLIEVTVIGLIFGYVFLRYGFLTAIFAHAAMDSILMGLSLMITGSSVNTAIGAVYLLVPALAGWLLSWLHARFGPKPKPPRALRELPPDPLPPAPQP
ncbi:CPBP family intramembrane glutamic endopeptidase [Paenibacillus mucilaginosus]|uniref:CPBP family intramembrane glutamic endopeptidase n=1 Tax=Paenibacillus mucilaginosus TaxID=61624 RepID=UPI00059F054D|nr:type II CAAX endopeptidase family protein [Paenibacillus mucilaginosus]MCG7214251.1 CPBP family intramembrane metalloprotease [Paenibacillus mucilaginosus]WDM28763.1 CPBP family intramembrane metalloprotease [Paenibacillus mucilaginosus]